MIITNIHNWYHKLLGVIELQEKICLCYFIDNLIILQPKDNNNKDIIEFVV